MVTTIDRTCGKICRRFARLFCRHVWQADRQHHEWIDGFYMRTGYDLTCAGCGRVKRVHDEAF